jgi:hypothetical protein
MILEEFSVFENHTRIMILLLWELKLSFVGFQLEKHEYEIIINEI